MHWTTIYWPDPTGTVLSIISGHVDFYRFIHFHKVMEE